MYLRALDFQIQGRKYLRALNAIRKYFVDRDSALASSVLLSTDPKQPRMNKVGEGSSVIVSFAVTTLVLTLFWLLLLTIDILWLVAVYATHFSPKISILAAVIVGVLLLMVAAALEIFHLRARLDKAERGDDAR